MLIENNQLASEFADICAACCIELFAAYGIALKPGAPEFADSDETLLCGVMGFAGGSVRGTCLLAANRAPIELSSPSKNRTRDWIGELTNQLLGRLKRKIVRHDLDILLTTPLVLSGVHLRPLPRVDLAPRVFSAGSGSILVWVEVEAAAGFSLGPPTADLSGSEGDILVF